MSRRIPVGIVTGFLGSGKTTLLNRVLRDPAYARTAVVINEFGAVPLDHLLVATPDENVVVLENGCLCCELRGDLVHTLKQLHERRESLPVAFDKVLIETSGLADPVPIIQTVVTDREVAPHFELDSVVTLVDAVNGAQQLAEYGEAVKQLAAADRIVLTKTDLADELTVQRLREELAARNPGAAICTAVRGALPPEEVFGAELHDRSAAPVTVQRWLRYDAYGERSLVVRDAHRQSTLASYSISYEQPLTQAGVAAWLNLIASLKGAQLLRCKGLLNVEGRPVAVHTVQALVHEPVELECWPDDVRHSRFVFITRDLSRADIERTFAAFDLRAPTTPVIDPRAYAEFLQVAQRFRQP